MTVSLTSPQVRAWRLERQLLVPRADVPATDVARVLCGVQAQVASAAELAIAARQVSPAPGEVEHALVTERSLVKTWTARGTLHLVPATDLPDYCAAAATLRYWDTPSWQRYHGVSADDVDRVVEVIPLVLDGVVLTREELTAAIVDKLGAPHLAERLGSGWSELLKPAAFRGLLCQGPPSGGRVTFTRPDQWLRSWRTPAPLEAGAALLRRYLAAHGPATMEDVARWWMRQRPSAVRPWFRALGDAVVPVEVDGRECWALAADLPSLAETSPAAARGVRLLPSFDQFVLAAARDLVPSQWRDRVFRTAGWVSPVVVADGHVAGTWERDGATVTVTAFTEVPARGLAAEVERLAAWTGRSLDLHVRPAA